MFYKIKIIFLGIFLFWFASAANAYTDQGIFVGPLKIKVWKSWMDSWNVDEIPDKNYLFELRRGINEKNDPHMTLHYNKIENSLEATVQCSGIKRVGEWDVAPFEGPILNSKSVLENGKSRFSFASPESCYDSNEKQIVRQIKIVVKNAKNLIFKTAVLPMYLRGKSLFYWQNSFDAYSAHAGRGRIAVETASASERGNWDTWNGVLVKPVISYFERNSITAGTVIGLHRHQRNQDMFFLESGEAVVSMGYAENSGKIEHVQKKWPGNSLVLKDTIQFEASGGWLERRAILPGQIVAIVPNPKKPKQIVFHGINAKSDAVFWTLGTKN